MKLAGIFFVFAITIGMSIYTLRPQWLAEAVHLPELLATDLRDASSVAGASTADPANAFGQVQQQLVAYVDSQRRSGTTGTPAQSAEIERHLQQLAELRSRLPNTDDNTDRLLLHAFFAAARLCPGEYRAPFTEMVRARVLGANEEVAAEARVLEFLIKYPLRSPITQEVVDDLREFADAYPRSAWGISLFSAASSQLWLSRQTNSAEQVLTLGLELYDEHPGRTRLVRQLVDQGHRPAPASQISAADWKLLERAIDSLRNTASPPVG